MKKILNNIELLTLIGGLAGLLFGLYLPNVIEPFYFLGDIFVSLLKVLITPFVSVSIFLALIKVKQKDQLKRLGLSTFAYYFLTSTLACFVGLLMANIFLSNLDPSMISKEVFASAPKAIKALSLDQFIASLFTKNIFSSFANSSILQIVVFSSFLGLAGTTLKQEHKKPLIDLADAANELLMAALKMVLTLAPVGVLVLITKSVSTSDSSIYKNLGLFFIATTSAAFIHAFISLPLIAKFVGKFNPLKFVSQVKEALIISISTASSSTTLPVSIQCLEDNAGVSKETTGFVTPLGATLNMDGSALYQSLIVIFLAKISGLDLSITQQLTVFGFIMFSSAGTAGIPGGGVVMVGMTLEALGLPLELLGVYLLVDRFWDYPITTINVWGDLVGAKTIDRFVKNN
jgi:Na+/H+-dicarboxylate symporter